MEMPWPTQQKFSFAHLHTCHLRYLKIVDSKHFAPQGICNKLRLLWQCLVLQTQKCLAQLHLRV